MNSNSQNYKPPLERSKYVKDMAAYLSINYLWDVTGLLMIRFSVLRSAPKLSCIEEFEEEENEEDYDDSQMTIPEYEAVNAVTTSYLPSHHPEVNGDLRRSPLSEESSSTEPHIPLSSSEEVVVETSPISHRKSYPPPTQVIHHPEGSRRPHTIPMDAKLNLPYMTGYDKVMHLLDMPAGDSHQLLLDDEDHDDDDQFSFAGRNSDPVASSPPGSDRDSESVVDSSCGEDEYNSKVARRRRRRSSSCDQKNDDREEEINDNVSDESGYSEEAVVNVRGETDLKMHPSGSPVIQKSSTKNLSSSTIIIMGGANHHGPMITDPAAARKTKTSTTTTFRSDDNGGTAVATTLVVYDNLCFEI